MTYCQRCILPTTRPYIRLNGQGVCNGCTTHAMKGTLDWAQREGAFRQVVQWARALSHGYDCVIPVSGGKDSTWQVVQCLEYGLTPLAVTWKSPARTPLGAMNLSNLIHLGVDHIDFQINPKVEKRFLYQALVRKGMPALPMHMAIFNIPLKVAVQFQIPLVVWGENSALEYGATEESLMGHRLNGQWLKSYGVTGGTTARDWVSEELTEKDLTPYFGPTDEDLSKNSIQAIFLGTYFPWDPVKNFKFARTHGFQAREQGPKSGYYNFADIDDDFISVHHYLKWHKFGFTRSFDHLSLEIRTGRKTREEAIEILRARGDETPHGDIAAFCEFVGITKERFFQVIETFRNRQIWTRSNGSWRIDGFLIPDWKWS